MVGRVSPSVSDAETERVTVVVETFTTHKSHKTLSCGDSQICDNTMWLREVRNGAHENKNKK